MEQKKDWFSLFYDNQNATYTDFLQSGIDPEDVQLLSKDDYKKNENVVKAFSNPDGSFNEQTFDTFYSQAISSYNTFSNGKFEEKDLPKLEFDIMSAIRRPDEKIQDITFEINKKRNPFIQTKGVSSILGTTESSLTPYELAQSNLIWDSEKHVWMNKTPEDLGFWGTISETPIVFARYEDDIEELDPESGRMVKHYKGEMKVDSSGNPYYETLGNRSQHGKELLSPFNVLTREGSSLNKFDFLDNDGKEKSIVGTVAQTVATVAPMFIPYVGQAYIFGLTAKNLSQLSIMLYKMFDGIANPDKKDYEYGLLNTIEGKLSSFNPGVTENSRENMVTWENFSNLMSDVVSQLYQQRFLASIPQKLGLGKVEQAAINRIRQTYPQEVVEKIMKDGTLSDSALFQTILNNDPVIANVASKAAFRNSILGKWLSSFYMSGISTMDVFYDGLDAGYDRRTSALTALLAMGATTAMIGGTEIGHVALKGLGFDTERALYRNASKKLINEVADKAGVMLEQEIKDKKVLNSMLRTAKGIYNFTAEQIARGGILGNAVAEGLEEMSEGGIMDFSKELTDMVTKITGTQKSGSFDFLASNPLQRYLMAGAGGFFGGALFSAMNRTPEMNQKLPSDIKEHIFYLLRNGKKAELKQELERYRQQGVAPKTLSATSAPIVENGQINYQPSTNSGSDISLNDAVINITNSLIDKWDAVINQENLSLNDDELIYQVALRDKRIADLLKFEGNFQMVKDFNNLGARIGELSIDIAKLKESLAPGVGKENVDIEGIQAEIQQKEAQLNDLRLQKNSILDGSRTEEYLSKVLFHLSPISDRILASNIYTYSEHVLGKKYSEMSESEQQDARARYEKYKESFDVRFNEGYNIFQGLVQKYNKELLTVADKLPVLNGVRHYLSQREMDSLLSLNETALRQFDISRQLNPEYGVRVNRGLDYILNHENIAMSDPLVRTQILDFFRTLDSNGVNVGIDVTEDLNSSNSYQEFTSKFIEFLSFLVPEIDGEITKFGTQVEKFRESLISTPLDQQVKATEEFLRTWIDSITDSTSFKTLFNNLVSLAVKDSTSSKEVFLKFGNLAEDIANKITYILTPKMRYESIRTLLEDAKKDGFLLTKDLYNYIKSYIKPDNKISLTKEDLNTDILASINEDLIGLVDLSNLQDLTPEQYSSVEAEADRAGLPLNNISQIFPRLSEAKDWFDVASALNNSNLSDREKRLIIDSINRVNKAQTKSSLEEVSGLINPYIEESKLVNNPITDLLQKVSIDVLGSTDGTNIYELLENENNNLKSIPTLSEFVVQGRVRQEQIDSAIQVVDMLEALVTSAVRSTDLPSSEGEPTSFGYNTTLNKFRQERGDTNLLPELDPNVAQDILTELERVKAKLNFFKTLSEKNRGNKLKEHKLTAISTRQAILKSYLDKEFTKNVPEVFEGIDAIVNSYDLESLYKTNLDEEEYIKLEKLSSEVEDKIYENIQGLTAANKYTKKQILNTLFQGYDYSDLVSSSYTNPKPLIFNTRELTPSQLYIHYHVIATVKSSNFNELLKKSLDTLIATEAGSKFFVPIFSQEYAAKINLAMILDSEFMNNITEISESKLKSIKDPIIRERYEKDVTRSKNLVFTAGAPGVGKTNGVGRLIHQMATQLYGTQNVVIAGPRSQQAINLANSILGTSYNPNDPLEDISSKLPIGNSIVNKEGLFRAILKDPSIVIQANEDFLKEKKADLEVVTYREEDDYGAYRLKPKYLDKSVFNELAFKDQSIVYIDEITHFSKFELELLTEWANLFNKKIITFGDIIQSGFNNGKNYFGIDVDNLFITSPTLSTSLRTTNVHKKDNSDALRTAIEQIYNLHKLNIPPSERGKQVNEILDSIPSLKYYESSTELHGEKITSYISTKEMEKLSENSPFEIGYIYDKEGSDVYDSIKAYNLTHDKKIKLYRVGDVQGLEGKYFIVDLHLENGFKSNSEKALKDLYTAVTRSEEGTIIIDNGLTNVLRKGSERVDNTNESTLSSQAAQDFSELRLKSLNAVLENSKPDALNTIPTSQEQEDPSRKNISYTLGKVIEDVFDKDETKAEKAINSLYTHDNKVKAHPSDSFIGYTYSNRVIESEYINYNGDRVYGIQSSITSNGLYDSDHTEFFNGRVTNLDPDKFQRVDSAILHIKSILYGFTSKKSRNLELSKISNEVNDVFTSVTGNTGELDLKNGEFKIKAIKYFRDGKIHSDGSNREERIRVIYRIPIINSSTPKQFIELSIYDLPNVNNSTFEKQEWFKQYKQFYSQVMNIFQSDNSKIYTSTYIDLNPDFELERITNLVIYKKGQDSKRHYNFEDKEKLFKGIYFSKPYVIANYTSEKSNRNSDLNKRSERIDSVQEDYNNVLSQYQNETDPSKKQELLKQLQYQSTKLDFEQGRYNLKGKAVVFATHAKVLYDEDGRVIPESEYGDYYIRQLNGEFDNKPDMADKVRMIVLNPEGLTFKQLYNNYVKYISSYKQNSNTLGIKFLKTYFGDYTGFDILTSILNYKTWLEVNAPDSKHYKIADRLYRGLASLSSVEDPNIIQPNKPQITEFHIMRIMERLGQENTQENLEQYKKAIQEINGMNVLKFFHKIIQNKIEKENGVFGSNMISNPDNSSIFFNFDNDISSSDILTFMDAATIGKVEVKDTNGDLITKEVPNYKPLFKNGIYSFPMMKYVDSKLSQSGDKEFIEAVNLEGTYFIDRDLQTPQFALVLSRDLADPTLFGVKGSLPSRQTATLESTEVESKNSSNRVSEASVLSSFNKSIDSLSPRVKEVIAEVTAIVKSEGVNITSPNQILDRANDKFKMEDVEYDEGTNIDYVTYSNNQFRIITKPKPSINIEENIGKFENNHVYLQSNFGDMFNTVVEGSDLDRLSNNVKYLQEISGEDFSILKNFILDGKYSQAVQAVLLSNYNILNTMIDINKVRSKYNIC
nr:MAG TPA: exodeoxyribonuclease V beta chain [Caudoviricetes sp.]